jgi:RNA polymerase sigma-B factor
VSIAPSIAPRRAEADRTRREQRTAELVDRLRACDDPHHDQALREQLVALTMPVAAAVARRYRNRGVPAEDLQQVAYLALTKAVKRYDAEAGHALLSYCVPTIRGEICRYFRDQGWTVRPPRRIQETQQQVSRAESTLTARLGHAPTEDEIAADIGQPVEEVREARAGQGCFTPGSLDRPVGGADQRPLGELIASETDEEAAAEARVVLAPAVRHLSDRDRRILDLRFVQGLTQREIAEDIGVTQMQVSRLLSRIFRDLRREVGNLDPADRTLA